MTRLQVSILGPVQAWRDGIEVPVGGSRVRTLLAALASTAGAAVPAAVLIDAIWADKIPADPSNALQTLVSRLRRALSDPSALVQDAGGYRLALAPMDVDAGRFSAQARAGHTYLRDGDPEQAETELRAALALWRGAALPELARSARSGQAAQAVGLAEQRLDAEEDCLDAQLQLGRADEVAAQCAALAVAHPLRERFTALLMTALHECGRDHEALEAYERLRRRLVEHLGSDPSAALQQLHLQLLRSDGPAQPARQNTNLRSPRTSFIGRTEQIERIGSLLATGRLVTVVGPGGAGKTRLAAVVAADWVPRERDGVWLVELAPITDPVNLARAVLGAVGLRNNPLLERRGEPTLATEDRLLDVLADAECLLVLDNCEHLITGVAELADRLLAASPGLRILATSREPLGIDGEALCVLPPMPLPPTGARAQDALEFPSVQLFAARAAAVSSGFIVDESSVAAVVEIVRRLDGLPLAIELAAARLRVLPVQEVAVRLSGRFRLLSGGNRAAMPRHRTLRAVVEWSWELLTPAEALLAERLAVFPSGATVSSAASICAEASLPSGLPANEGDIGDLLSQLVDKSLLQSEPRRGVRYRMLETLREYGIEQLAARDEVDAVRRVHARYFADLVAQAEPWLTRSEQLDWLRRLEDENDNILAALRYLGDSGDAAAAMSMARSLGWYWTLLDGHTEATTWLRFALDVPDPHGTVTPGVRTVVEALQVLNTMATVFSERSSEQIDAGLARLTGLDQRLQQLDSAEDPKVLMLRPMLLFFGGVRDQVFELLEHSIATSDPWIRATSLMFRAGINENDGVIEPMRADVDTALELFTALGDRWGMASTLSLLAQLHVLDGDLGAAIEAYQRAATYMHEFGSVGDEVLCRLRLSGLHARVGNFQAATREAELVDTLEFRAGSHMQRMMADSIDASIAMMQGDPAQLHACLIRLRQGIEQLDPVHPLGGHLRAALLGVLGSVQAELGQLDAAAVTLTEAHAVALGTRDMPITAAVGQAVAGWAERAGRPRDAALMLGASAALRGADDPTDPMIARLRARLRDQLGAAAEDLIATGRALDRNAALARIRPL